MKGTRTYQIAVILFTILAYFASQIFNYDLHNTTKELTELFVSIAALYASILTVYKIAKPHKMVHEDD